MMGTNYFLGAVQYRYTEKIQKHKDTKKKLYKNYYHKPTTKITTVVLYILIKSCCIISSKCLITRKQNELPPSYDCRDK